jgi:uncharacterized OB-fold protein
VTDWLVSDSLAPSADGALAPLYEAAERGELAVPFCGACNTPLELEQLRCDICGSAAATWRVVERRGTVHSVTTVHRREPGLIVAMVPYHVVDVELVSGHRLLMTTSAPIDRSPAISEPAEITFRRVAGRAIPALAVPGQAVSIPPVSIPSVSNVEASS